MLSNIWEKQMEVIISLKNINGFLEQEPSKWDIEELSW